MSAWSSRARPSRPQGRRFSAADILLAIALLGACAGLVAIIPHRAAPLPLTGRAYAIDGDSLRLGNEDVRLAGIDAPELHQTCTRYGEVYDCGRVARSALAARLAGGEASCQRQGGDVYGRTLAICSVKGADINAALVSEGTAISFGRYQSEEAAAKAARRGLWAGTFEKPADWRHRHPRTDLRDPR